MKCMVLENMNLRLVISLIAFTSIRPRSVYDLSRIKKFSIRNCTTRLLVLWYLTDGKKLSYLLESKWILGRCYSDLSS
jgi:hypothetical protein